MRDSELLQAAAKSENIVIMGHTAVGDYLYEMLKTSCPDSRVSICDTSGAKQGAWTDTEVLSTKEAVKCFPDAKYVLAGITHKEAMKEQLLSMGIPAGNILFGVTKESLAYRDDVRAQKKYIPRTEIIFEIDLASHCNLNCKCCSQFSPISKKEFLDVRQMERDFARMGELFHGTAERIFLIGGEPLLHPQVEDCMTIARNYFPRGEISLFSNGLLLLSQPDSFWQLCKEKEIGITITKYPIHLDYDRIEEKLGQENIRLEYFGDSADFKYMTNLGLDETGSQDIRYSFEHCDEANQCIKLKDGKLFTCTRPAAIHRFNDYFGKDLKVLEEDYIDIYKADSACEILEFLAQPIPFCKYCNFNGVKHAMEWGASEKKIEEWT